jgi:2-oxo-hept-3-ene-1,7-dioate hydratase
VPFERFIVPRVEIELVFVLGKPLKGPGVGLLDVLRATEYVVPAIEIIDARVQNPRKIFDTVADNGAAAGLVVGGRAVGPMDVDLRWVGGLMYRNADIEETASPPACSAIRRWASPGSPTRSGRFGTVLEPGRVMLSGSFIRPVWAQKGDTLRADFGPLGSLGVQFV